MITYRYLSDGTKLSAEAVLEPEIDEGDGIIPAKIYRRRYKGNFTYVTDPDTGEETLESIAWDEGMIYLRKMAEPSESMDTLAVLDAGNHIIYDRWYVKDHLGNVRTVVELGSHAGEIVEQDDYLPFGTRFIPATQGVICTMDTELYGSEHDNRYRYAGKEEQRFGQQIDLALLDFGARAYDPFTARWTSVDPLAHKYLGLTPYNYCGNNSICSYDPNGCNISTHTDENGYVLAVYDDGDLGVYMHENGTIREDLDSKHTRENTSVGGTKMGESWQIDSFESFVGNKKDRIIYGSSELTDRVNQIIDSNPSIITYARKAQSKGDWDIKTKVMNGSLLYGKYASPRDAGNFAAGMFSQSKGEWWSAIIDFGYGAYNACGNKKLPTALLTAYVLLSPYTSYYMPYIAEHGEDSISRNAQRMGKTYYKETRK